MRNYLFAAVAAAAVTLGLASCGPPPEPRYPSYDAIVSQYVPLDRYEGVLLEDQSAYPSSPHCHCARVWYHDHWVYYYHGHWIYWHHGYWYHYPVFYVYYFDGLPYVYAGPHRSIVKVADGGGGGTTGSAIHASPSVRKGQRSTARSRGSGSSRRSTSRSEPPAARKSTSSSSRSEPKKRRR